MLEDDTVHTGHTHTQEFIALCHGKKGSSMWVSGKQEMECDVGDG